MKRLFLLLTAVLILVGCQVNFKNTKKLGKVDSTSVQSVGGKTVQLVYVGGNEYSVSVTDNIKKGDLMYEAIYHPHNAAPPFVALCKHGFRAGQSTHDLENGDAEHKGKNPELCFRIQIPR